VERRKQFDKYKRNRVYWKTNGICYLCGDPVLYIEFTIEHKKPLSWTISKDYAERYKTMFNKKTVIWKMVAKSEVFALIERMDEEEVIIL